jgi:cellulose synthase/poly-beta-1,6-N-acetylglucosamine synthase-like glycosyltransferase
MCAVRALITPVRLFVTAAQFVFVAVSLYQSGITLVGYLRGNRPLPPSPAKPRFLLIVCARNEAKVLGGIVTDLLAQDYPRNRYDVLVVAHNCTDQTAEAAAAAGARVVERRTDLPGKSHAIAAGLAAAGGGADFTAVFDADSRVRPDLLATVAAAAATDSCIQVETIPFERQDWLASGYGLGRRARNLFWWRPRAALGLGTTISGTGFFVRTDLLERLLPRLRTLTEDLELTALLAGEGIRIAHLPATAVSVDEPHELRQSMRQRLRWVRGHIGVVRHGCPRLLRRALRGDFRALDLAVYLLMPSRIITRTGATGSLLLALLRVPFALPLPFASLAFAGEWLLPLCIALRERLIPLSPAGISVAARHTLLSLLWFPIGIWALVTSRRWDWPEATRAANEKGASDAPRAA